jgi:hypothetical protein
MSDMSRLYRRLDVFLVAISAEWDVRRAPFGPGLRPGPRRQACWGRQDSGAQGWVPEIVSAKRLENDLRVPLTPEGLTRTVRGVPARRQ